MFLHFYKISNAHLISTILHQLQNHMSCVTHKCTISASASRWISGSTDEWMGRY